MKKYVIILSTLLFILTGFAQNSGESKAILDKTYSNYKASNGIKLSFSTTTKETNGTTYDPQRGEAFIKGDKFRIEMEAMNIWFNGNTQWVLLKDLDEVNISNPTKTELATVSPLSLLGIYKEGFNLKAPVSKTINGVSVYQIEMVPTINKGDLKVISVAIDKKQYTIVQAILTMSNNIQNKIDVTNYNANYKFEDKEFTFDKSKHPDVEIVDLR